MVRYSFSLLRVSAPAARRGEGRKKGQRKKRTTEEKRAKEREREGGRGSDIYE